MCAMGTAAMDGSKAVKEEKESNVTSNVGTDSDQEIKRSRSLSDYGLSSIVFNTHFCLILFMQIGRASCRERV